MKRHKGDEENFDRKIGANELVIPCEQCDLRFIKEAYLLIHMNDAHTKKPEPANTETTEKIKVACPKK